jgi:hypothetical protein
MAFMKNGAGRSFVAAQLQHEIRGITLFVDGLTQIGPLAFHFDIGFIPHPAGLIHSNVPKRGH